MANFQFFNYEQLPTVVHEVMLSIYILLYIKINQDWSRHQILHHIIFLLDKISRATEHTWAASDINLSESTMKLHNGKISKLIKEQIIYCQSSNGKIHSRLRARLCYHCKRKNAVWFPIFYPRSTNIECKEHVYIFVRTQSPSFH